MKAIEFLLIAIVACPAVVVSENGVIDFEEVFQLRSQFVDLRVKIVTDDLDAATLAIPLFKIWAQSEAFTSVGIFINFTIQTLVLDKNPVYYKNIDEFCLQHSTEQSIKNRDINLMIIFKALYSAGAYGRANPTLNCMWISRENIMLSGAIFAHEFGHMLNQHHFYDSFMVNPDCTDNYYNLMNHELSPDSSPDPKKTRLTQCGATPVVPSKFIATSSAPTRMVAFKFDRQRFCELAAKQFDSTGCPLMSTPFRGCNFCYMGSLYNIDNLLEPSELACDPELAKETPVKHFAFKVIEFKRHCVKDAFKISQYSIDNYRHFKQYIVQPAYKPCYRSIDPPEQHPQCKINGCVISCKPVPSDVKEISTVMRTGEACYDDTGVCLAGYCLKLIGANRYKYVFYDRIPIASMDVTAIPLWLKLMSCLLLTQPKGGW